MNKEDINYEHVLGLLQMSEPVFLSYYPGNGTRFDLVFTAHIASSQVDDEFMGYGMDEKMVVVSLVNFRRSYQFPLLDPQGFCHASYVAEKLQLGASDAIELTKLFNRICEAGTPAGGHNSYTLAEQQHCV